MDGMSPTAQQTAVVFAGGEAFDVGLLPLLPPDALFIAADSGLHNAERLGVSVDVVVGDMDSVDPEALEAATAAGAAIDRHTRDKDATDLELALAFATSRRCLRIIVIGGAGGRLDHFLANALLLTSPDLAGIAVEWWTGLAHISIVRPGWPVRRESRTGDVISLVAIPGTVDGVRTSGLRWALEGATLESGSTRGISNEATGAQFSVSISDGVLLAIHYEKAAIT